MRSLPPERKIVTPPRGGVRFPHRAAHAGQRASTAHGRPTATTRAARRLADDEAERQRES